MSYLQLFIVIVSGVFAFVGAFKIAEAKASFESSWLGCFLLTVGICVFFAVLIYMQITVNLDNERAVAQYKEGNSTLYIDGKPVGDDFDIDGIDVGNYSVKIDGDKIYLMTK